MADPVIPLAGEALADGGLAPRRRSPRYPKDHGTAEERKARAADAMTKYRIKRGLINTLERLDCVADAEFIAAIASVVLKRRK